MKLTLSVIIAVLTGLFILAATFLPDLGWDAMQSRMVDWAVVLAGISLLIGIFNLLRSHWVRMGLNLPEKPEAEASLQEGARPTDKESQTREAKPVKREKIIRHADSAVLLFGFVVAFIGGVILTPANNWYLQAVSSIQVPVESSLLAILSIVLLTIVFQFFQHHHDLMGFVFIGSVLVFLVLGSGLLHSMSEARWVKDVIAMLNEIPLAGTRGIVIGIALGSIVTALRQLLGFDRAYRE
ncbi:MAG TPA: hypothetical protein ENN32_06775 [Chloroflexi bacterium]|nr:hypothetical protein [Chloroflexota bacterium]